MDFFLLQSLNQLIKLNSNQNEIVENSEAPKLIDTQKIDLISRDKAINSSERILFENENIFGSISLSNRWSNR